MSIEYKEGYDYWLVKDYSIETGISLGKTVSTKLLSMTAKGLLTIREGYAWDGASGPAIDTKTVKRASLIHDAIYQLIREGYIHPVHKERADELFIEEYLKSCDKLEKRNAFSALRAWYMRKAVDRYGDDSIKPRINEIKVAV